MQEDPLFEQFVAERVDGLLRYGYVLTGNPHDAADLVQEALVRLRGSWSRVRRKSALDGYVRTTMTRLHINSWRVRKREHITATPPYDPMKWKEKRVASGDLLNIKTGKRSKASVEPPAFCGISWCVKGGTLVSREGGTRDLPGMPNLSSAPALDRFLLLTQRTEGGELRGQVLYDVTTRRGADLGLRPVKRGKHRGMPTAVLDYRAPGLFRYDRDGKQVIVNLRAIR